MGGRVNQRCNICGAVSQKSRCAKCTARKRGEYNRMSNRRNQRDPHRAFYQSPEWRRISRNYLDRYSRCVLCGGPSKIADHWPLSRKQLLSMGYADPDADHRLRALCKTCDSRQTAQRQPGGWHKQYRSSNDDEIDRRSDGDGNGSSSDDDSDGSSTIV